MHNSNGYDSVNNIAIIGLSGRFPGARNVQTFWENLKNGVESISFFSDQELEPFGVEASILQNPEYVKAKSILDDVDMFDASFFGFSPREAEILDPQQRVFLECAWEVLEHAGYDPESYPGRIGVYGGANRSTYLLNTLHTNHQLLETVSPSQVLQGNDKDYLATRVSYKLNLQGPSINVNTACSTSLVAVCLACQGLLSYQCDMALAGGVSIGVPIKEGYFFQEGGMVSPDGHCRAFDAKAQGTVFGDGAGIVALKRLEDAIADRDCIHAIIIGSALNNDGSDKVGFTAPSVDGQAEVIAEALAVADIDPRTISYVEAHGTGTSLGDPIEIAALSKAFQATTNATNFCAIGSVKTNIGHLNTAAGIVGLIKTILALKHQLLPPSLHFEQPNPKIDFLNSPFFVNTKPSPWMVDNAPRRAGVSSLGVGGTNAHVILEEAPVIEDSGASRSWQLLVLSARTTSALNTITENLVEYLIQHPEVNLADVMYTLQTGRRTFGHRRMLVCQNYNEVIQALNPLNPQRVLSQVHESGYRPVVFMFSGQGAQYINMALDLYRTEPVFRNQINRCTEILQPHLGIDLHDVLYPKSEHIDDAYQQLSQTAVTQPALFVIEYALAQLWISWGIQPQAMIGHSIGEYVAACLANVFSLEDALRLVAARGRLMQTMPPGAMLAVSLSEADVQPLLNQSLTLAAVNGPERCVVSGHTDSVENLQHQLTKCDVHCRRLQVSHAFHSVMLEPMIEPFIDEVRQATLRSPEIPYLSNLTGHWIREEEATNPNYWAMHLRQTVRFEEGLCKLLEDPDSILLEVGPGRTLSTLAQSHPTKSTSQAVYSSLRHPQDQQSDDAFLLTTLGQLWLSGVQIDWSEFHASEKRCHLPLPTYPFERQRFWVESQLNHSNGKTYAGGKSMSRKNPDIADWFYIPSWKRASPPQLLKQQELSQTFCWMLFIDASDIGVQLAQRLKQLNQNVVLVKIGEQFSKESDDLYSINPRSRGDYDVLFKECRKCKKLPQRIIHSWNVTAIHQNRSDTIDLDASLNLGFYSLLFLSQVCGEQDTTDSLHFWIISNHIQDVTGDEEVRPEKATVLGPCKIIPKEYPHIVCRNIDVIIPSSESPLRPSLIDYLLAEILAEQPEPVIAYRGNYRWVQTFESIRLEKSAQVPKRLRKQGVYLITGGLGGIGLTLANHLAKTLQAKLILMGRSSLPPRDEWREWLNTHDAHNTVSSKIRNVLELEKLGAEVLLVSADVTSQEETQAVVSQALARFGHINGVIHSAGLPDGAVIHRRDREDTENILAPKVKGTLVLESTLKHVPLDFFVLCSSLSSILAPMGQVAYCAANAFLDAFAHRSASTSEIWTVSINWDAWQEVGMAEDAARQIASNHDSSEAPPRKVSAPIFQHNERNVLPSQTPTQELSTRTSNLYLEVTSPKNESHISKLQNGLTPSEGIAVFNRILENPMPQITISTQDLGMRYSHIPPLIASYDKQRLEEVGLPETTHSRPNLRTTFVAPRNETEETLAAIWQTVLGIQQIGIYDNFFELGGDSLIALQIRSRLRTTFLVDVPLTQLLEGTTVANLAEYIDTIHWTTQERPTTSSKTSSDRDELEL